MKRRLAGILACPGCGGDLGVMAGDGDEIVDGALGCLDCGRRFPIVRGVPRCLLEDASALDVTRRTRRYYDFTWTRFGQREITENWEKDSARYVTLIPSALLAGEGRLGLEAGCGGGADLLRLSAGGAELIGCDLSAGVESAYRATRHLPNVHVVQADIHRLPFRPGAFDFAYSFGVLHHLPRPAAGFAALARLLRPEAPLVTYLYEDFSDRSGAERAGIAAVRAARAVTNRLPARVLYALCLAGAPAVWLAFSMPAHVLRRRLPRLAVRLPFRHTRRLAVLASDLFDRFAPPVEWRYSQDGILALYREAGFERIESRQYRGWVSWGTKRAVEATTRAPV